MTESAKLFQCPACGAPLELPNGLGIMKCSYCKSSIVVPGASHLDLHGQQQGNQNIEKVIRQLQLGNKLEAIKAFREITGSGLSEAKAVLDAIENGQAVDITHFFIEQDSEVQSLGTPDTRFPPSKPLQAPGSTLNIPTLDLSSRSRRAGCLPIAIVVGLFIAAGMAVAFFLLRGQPGAGSLVPVISIPTFADPILSFGEQGTGPGMLNDPRAVGVDRDGNIYAADYGDGRINVYDSGGKFLRMINLGAEVYVQGFAVSPDGTVYASFAGDIHIMNSSGQELDLLTPEGTDLGSSGHFESIALGADGSLYASDWGENILRFGPDRIVNLVIPQAFTAVTGDPELDIKLAVDGLGNIFALGTFNNLVLKYSPTGTYLDQFGGDTQHPAEGVDEGRFQAPDAIAVDGYGRIFVSDIWGVQVFGSNGQFQEFFQVDGVAFGMTFDLDNNLYIASNRPLIVKLQLEKP